MFGCYHGKTVRRKRRNQKNIKTAKPLHRAEVNPWFSNVFVISFKTRGRILFSNRGACRSVYDASVKGQTPPVWFPNAVFTTHVSTCRRSKKPWVKAFSPPIRAKFWPLLRVTCPAFGFEFGKCSKSYVDSGRFNVFSAVYLHHPFLGQALEKNCHSTSFNFFWPSTHGNHLGFVGVMGKKRET